MIRLLERNSTAGPSIAREVDVVAIGASAGGVEALDAILPALPPHFPVPVLVVLHLPADAKGEVSRLFTARCALPVIEAADKEPLRAGAIYFAPGGYHLLIDSARICALSTEDAVNFSRPSIDVLFQSCAWVFGARTLGILLTGASADGADGMQAIHAAGGVTWAQDADTARAPTMPLAAITRGVVDHVLTLEEIARSLREASGQVASTAQIPDQDNA